MEGSDVYKNMAEHYKLMAEFFKHLSALSITLILLAVALSSELFKEKECIILLIIGIFFLVLCSIFSVYSQLQYADVFRVPELLTGKNYPKLAIPTGISILTFIFGATFVSLYIAFSTTTAHAEPVVDILKIAGKSEGEVAKYLGAPRSCGKIKHGNKCQYFRSETEIVFINSKADWITIEGIDSTKFSKSALTALGLNEANPSFENSFTLRWNSIQGLMEVSLFKGASNSGYAYIKTKTK